MTTRAVRLLTIIVGPGEHGVVRHARLIAAAVGSDTVCVEHSAHVTPITDASADLVHLHYTDRLFGPDTTSAATAFAALASRIDVPIVVTLHDVPLLDGTTRSVRLAQAYRTVAGAATTAIVSSMSELRRLDDIGIGANVAVIPLPVPHQPTTTEPVPDVASARAGDASTAGTSLIGVLGFIYPGKGHADVIDAVAGLRRDDIVVVAVGRPSDGHEQLQAELTERARRSGQHLVTTGYLDDRDIAAWIAHVDVPVVPAIQPSASASLHTWIAGGRRPLVAASPYGCEVASHGDGLVTLYRPGDGLGLAEAIARALVDPASTWRVGPPPRSLTMAAVADAHRDVYVRAARRA